MPVSKRLRFEILRRDNHACRYCGASAPETALVVDHVVPVALGGSDEPSNLVAACAPCNSGKSATPAGAAIVDDVAADAVRWADAMAKAAILMRANARERRNQREEFAQSVWGQWTFEHRGQDCVFTLPADWESSIDRFIDAGICKDDFTEAVRIAMASRTHEKFKYMCGILWRWITERQEIAMEIVGDQSDADR